jgi:hypothetical protein
MYQYRITVDGTTGAITSEYPGALWTDATDHCEDRGLAATFERRLVTDLDILDMLVDTTGYIKLGARVACPWEVLAEMR